MRVHIIGSVIIVAFSILFLSIFNLQVIKGDNYKDQSDKNCIRLLPQAGARGNILDRNSNIIVGNYLSYDVMIMPQDKKVIDKTLEKVGEVLGINITEIKSRFKKGYLAPFIPVIVANNVDSKKAVVLGELKTDYSSIIIQAHPLRYYPYGKLACHVVGYLNEIDHWRLTKLEDYGYKTKDIVGFGGVEEKYDYYLREDEGALSIEVDHRGRFIRILGFKPPKDGKDIQLTLDLEIQKIAEDAIGDRKASVVIMDPFSGEILAMASNPGFNPAIFINKKNNSIAALDNSALINRSISAGFAPGSIFKLVGASAGLETNKINLATTYTCTGSMRVGNRDFKCWDTHGDENLAQAIAHSCDVYFYRTGLLLGPQAIHDYAQKFSLGKATGIDLPYEVNGFVPEPLWKRIKLFQNWYNGDTANFVIGQGYTLLTPVQAVRFMAVFANKGDLVTPFIIRNIGGKDMLKSRIKITKAHIKDRVINYLRQDLRGVVNDPTGTANILANLPVSVAGKTGTAEVGRNQTHGWFVGFFPFEKPKYVICVFLESSGSGHSASAVAKQIIGAMSQNNSINLN